MGIRGESGSLSVCLRGYVGLETRGTGRSTNVIGEGLNDGAVAWEKVRWESESAMLDERFKKGLGLVIGPKCTKYIEGRTL